MIYAGFINFGSLSLEDINLKGAIDTFSDVDSSIIRKKNLVLCFGKRSQTKDMDRFLENDTAILMGRAFDKEKSCSLEKAAFKRLSNLDKERALKQIWGKYVYIQVNNESSEFEIVVDSAGQLPFFYYPLTDGSLVFASDIEILFRVLRQKPEYNWNYLCSYLFYGNSSAIQTPFNGVFEVPPACSLQISKRERKTKPFINTLNSYQRHEIQEQGAVTAIQKTLKPWIKPYKSICVSLSGGLDSSSLVYCLKDIIAKDQTLTALNYFHSTIQSSNELVHARQVCKEVGIDLIEVDASNSLPFDRPLHKRRLNPNKPIPGLLCMRWEEAIEENLNYLGAYTFLSGHGSDHIFMRPPTQKAVTDYILENGLKGCKAPLNGLAHFYRDSLFPILKANVRSLSSYFFRQKKDRRHRTEAIKNLPCWIKRDLIQPELNTYSHPIYDHLSSSILPGKYDQIDALFEGLASIHVEVLDQISPTFYPFLYEPVVEFALSFPTYKLFARGYDRYPLRQSVGDHFGTEIVWRRDKSQTTGIFQLGLKRNIAHVLELCLEGQLAKRGLIEKESLRKTIHLIANGDIQHLWSLGHLASTELFLNYWEGKSYA